MPDPSLQPQGQAPDPQRFRLGGLLSSMAPGPESRGIPNLLGGATYAVSPEQRAIYNNTQGAGVAGSSADLTKQRSLMQYMSQNHGDLASTNPDLAALIAHAHEAGFQASKAGTEANQAQTLWRRQKSALEGFNQNGGATPESALLTSQVGTAQAGQKEAEERARMTGAQAGTAQVGEQAAQGQFGRTGTTPEMEAERERLAQQRQIAGAELGEKHGEFKQQIPLDVLRAISGYGGIGMMSGPGGIENLGNVFQQALKNAGVSLDNHSAVGGQQFPSADHALEQEYRQSKGAAPAPTGTGPGAPQPSKGVLSSLFSQGTNQSGVPSSVSQQESQLRDQMIKMFSPPENAARSSELNKQLRPGIPPPKGMSTSDVDYLSDYLSKIDPSKAKAMIQQLLKGANK